MAKLRIRRKGHSGLLTRIGLRSAAALGLAGLAATLIVPIAASRSMALSSSAITIPLAPAQPYSPDANRAALLGATTLAPAAPGTSAEEIGAMVEAALNGTAPAEAVPFVAPALFSPGLPATAYAFRSRSPADNLRAAMCLTAAIYYEAGNEPDEGQRAVAQVVLNRVRHPAFPKTVCDVVYQGTERPGVMCQFSYACDGSMARTPSLAGWMRARRVAQLALAGSTYAPVGYSTNYHTLAVSPAWGKTLTPTAIVGAHIFYRLPGGAGGPQAFTARYFGHEPVPGPRAKLFVPDAPLVMADAGVVVPVPVAGQWVDPALAVVAAPTNRVASIAPTKRVAEDKRYVSGSLPDSDVLPQYRDSGSWIGR
jgi:Cell Wall Hydrolase